MTEQSPASVPSKEWNAAAYHVLSEPQFHWGLRVLDRISLSGHERVLDAGCGSGRLTKELVRRVPQGFVVACDLSENMTHAAMNTLGDQGTVVCADLLNLPFRSAFDLVFSTATFHWIRDHDSLFSELRNVLQSGGRVEAQCGGGANLAVVHARAKALAAQSHFRAYYDDWHEPWLFASPRETEARLRRAGFTRAKCSLEHAPTEFPDANRYRAFLEAVVMRPFLSRLPSAELRNQFLDLMLADAGRDDPPYTLDYWRLNISATAP
jgi:trans-aconitate methyltransferase